MEKIHLPQPKVKELHAVCKEHDNDPGELINITPHRKYSVIFPAKCRKW